MRPFNLSILRKTMCMLMILFMVKYIINQQDTTLAVLCLLTTTSMLYMFRTPFASIIRSTTNYNSTATRVCHELGWNKSCIDVKVGEHCTIPWPKCGIVLCSPALTSIQDLFQPNSWQTPVAAVTVYSAPDDGYKERPKHVQHTCSC